MREESESECSLCYTERHVGVCWFMSASESRLGWVGLVLVAAVVLGAGAAWIGLVRQRTGSEPGWAGVDEAVIGQFAQAAGRPAEPSFAIDWIQGDLLLFAFLCAGLIAGGFLGFYARVLFVEQRAELFEKSTSASASPHARERS